MDPVTRLATLRKAHYACQRRDANGRKCQAPARNVALVNDKPEARCPSCLD